MINIDIILYIAYTLIFAILLYFIYRIQVKNKQILAGYIQAELDKRLLGMEIAILQEEKAVRELSESDGFVKFISESREWAFEYIEQVQKSLLEFDKAISPILEWNRTYGSALNENLYSPKIKEISLAYERLQSLLPKDNETPNN